jgi:XTP/dITP diphosphohydrolase
MRKFSGGRLVLASHNAGKLRELSALLAPYGAALAGAGELGLPEPEETGASFAENARLKALAAAKASGHPALADDSGLAVAALDGAPGIYSARWAGPGKDFSAAMARVLKELDGTPDRSAAFVCALALAWPDGHVEEVEGRVAGGIAEAPRGEGGFGYDPIFLPLGQEISFAEMPLAAKQAVSHRADALSKLILRCFA